MNDCDFRCSGKAVVFDWGFFLVAFVGFSRLSYVLCLCFRGACFPRLKPWVKASAGAVWVLFARVVLWLGFFGGFPRRAYVVCMAFVGAFSHD
jgi:hypothetical protein